MNRLVWLALASVLLLAACDFREDDWPGVSAAEPNGDEIYVAYGNFIARLDIDPAAGEYDRQWVYPSAEQRGPSFYARTAVHEDAVYIGDYEGGVHAIDRASGEGLWTYEQSGTSLFGFVNFGGSPDRIIGSIEPGFVNDQPVVFVPDEQGVFALAQDQESQEAERLADWLFETEHAVWTKPMYVPAQDDQPARLYVSSLDQHLYALNPDDADVLWAVDLGGASAGNFTSYTIDGQEVLLIGTFNSELVAVSLAPDIDNAQDRIVARYGTEGWLWEGPGIFDAETANLEEYDADDLSGTPAQSLYVADMAGYLYSLTLSYSDEDERFVFIENWKTQVTEEGQFRATPVVTPTRVIINSDNERLYAYDRTGEQVWEEELSSQSVSALLWVSGDTPDDDLLVTGTNERSEMVIGRRIRDGESSWSYEHED